MPSFIKRVIKGGSFFCFLEPTFLLKMHKEILKNSYFFGRQPYLLANENAV